MVAAASAAYAFDQQGIAIVANDKQAIIAQIALGGVDHHDVIIAERGHHAVALDRDHGQVAGLGAGDALQVALGEGQACDLVFIADMRAVPGAGLDIVDRHQMRTLRGGVAVGDFQKC